MTPVDGIHRLGFRRWYERQLIESHGWLVTCVLAIVLVASGLELLSLKDGIGEFLSDALLIGAGLWLSLFAWRRYARQMLRAEAIGGQAVCPQCQHYGFRTNRDPGDLSPARRQTGLDARCGKCGCGWRIEVDDAG